MKDRQSKLVLAISLLTLPCALAQTTTPPHYTVSVLYQFATDNAPDDGITPNALILGLDGNFFGTTSGCNNSRVCSGTVFQITPQGNLTTIHEFQGGADGYQPGGALALDRGGAIYGMTDGNTTYRVSRDGVFTSFGYVPGASSSTFLTHSNGLVYGADGNLYGSAQDGGMVFQLTPAGDMTTIQMFQSFISLMVPGPGGALYGVLSNGSSSRFVSVTPGGVATTLADLSPWGIITPVGMGPVLGPDGNFYIVGHGLVLKVTPSGVVTAPPSATGGVDFGSVMILGSDGNLYIFAGQLETVSTSLQLTVVAPPSSLLNFTGTIDGIVQGPDGFYSVGPYGQSGAFTRLCQSCSTSGGGYTTGSAPPLPTPGPLDAIDPNGNDPINNPDVREAFLGNLPVSASVNGEIVNFHPAANGFAADGVTPLVLRWRVPGAGKVTFTITDENNRAAPPGQVGSVCGFTGSSCVLLSTTAAVDAVQVSGAAYYAFAILTSPPDFARAGVGSDQLVAQRPINISANFTGQDGTSKFASATLAITRPPVVLLHGIWSSRKTWTWTISIDPRFHVYPQDYSATAADSFDVNLGLVSPATPNQPQAGIAKALCLLRSRGIAATQADFIGHSMGGLLARIYAAGDKGIAYMRDDNLQAGDIHKLITVDTPHNGSEMATAILNPKNLSAASNFGALGACPSIARREG